MINLIDVTLRDGGHAVDFNWPLDLAKKYYSLLSSINDIKYIELGYWGQTSKSKNRFYNLNMEEILKVTNKQRKNNVSIMIDYHYCSHDLKKYPTADQEEIGMIRMCSRKEDISNALTFGDALKKHTGLNVSFNVFNATNYSAQELSDVASTLSKYNFDYVYFADTHGCLDLREDFKTFENALSILKGAGKKVGMHLHDHSGKGYLNYSMLEGLGFESTDTSIRGMGKGSGNLKLEYVVGKNNLTGLAQFIKDNENILTMKPIPYELITAKYSLTDNYAKQGYELNMDLETFDKLCSKICGQDKDTYNDILLK